MVRFVVFTVNNVNVDKTTTLNFDRKEMFVMARHRRKSTILESARQRLAGLKEITPKPDFGPGLSVESFEAEVNGFRDVHDSYNGDLAALDDKTNELEEREQRLADFNQRILAAVKGLYGPDSSEYEQVGGLRRRDRKRPARTQKPATT